MPWCQIQNYNAAMISNLQNPLCEGKQEMITKDN